MRAYAKSRGLSTARAKEAMEDEFDRTYDGIAELMDDVKFSLKVSGDEEYSASQRVTIIEGYKSVDVKVKDAKIVKLRVTLKSHGEKLELAEPVRVPLIKVGGSWYVDYDNLNGGFAFSLWSAITSALWSD